MQWLIEIYNYATCEEQVDVISWRILQMPCLAKLSVGILMRTRKRQISELTNILFKKREHLFPRRLAGMFSTCCGHPRCHNQALVCLHLMLSRNAVCNLADSQC